MTDRGQSCTPRANRVVPVAVEAAETEANLRQLFVRDLPALRVLALVSLALAGLLLAPSPAQAGYRDGMSLYEYVGSGPVTRLDSRGLQTSGTSGGLWSEDLGAALYRCMTLEGQIDAERQCLGASIEFLAALRQMQTEHKEMLRLISSTRALGALTLCKTKTEGSALSQQQTEKLRESVVALEKEENRLGGILGTIEKQIKAELALKNIGEARVASLGEKLWKAKQVAMALLDAKLEAEASGRECEAFGLNLGPAIGLPFVWAGGLNLHLDFGEFENTGIYWRSGTGPGMAFNLEVSGYVAEGTHGQAWGGTFHEVSGGAWIAGAGYFESGSIEGVSVGVSAPLPVSAYAGDFEYTPLIGGRSETDKPAGMTDYDLRNYLSR